MSAHSACVQQWTGGPSQYRRLKKKKKKQKKHTDYKHCKERSKAVNRYDCLCKKS